MGGKNKSAAEECADGVESVGTGAVPGKKVGVHQCGETHWVGLRVEDEEGAVVKNIKVYMEVTDGNDYTFNLAGVANPTGSYIHPKTLPDGNCKFGLPEVHDVEWWPKGETPAAVACEDHDKGGRGRCAASIADDRDYRNYHSFWDDTKNKPLRDKNRNPNQLTNKDTVFYPDRKKKIVAKAVDQVWTLVVKKKRPTKLRIVLFGRDDKPLANAAWKLVEPLKKNGTTGADGLIEIDNFPPQEEDGELLVTLPARPKVGPVPANAAGAPLAYPPPLIYTQYENEPPEEPKGRNSAEWELEIGWLQPSTADEGVLGRLGNIGFRCDPDSGENEATRAVKAYQRFYLKDKKPSGKPSDIAADLLPRHDNP